MTWDILIPHIPHRHDQLVELLDVLEPQMRPGVSVVIYSDNLEADYATKCQTLLEASTADYISFLSNDDSVAPDFVERIWEALLANPDYVGFRVRYTVNGQVEAPIVHSLQFDHWGGEAPGLIYRDIVHFNPIRRDLANRVRFRGHLYADRDWADDLRAIGDVQDEVFIDAELLYYQWKPHDSFTTERQPLAEVPVLPAYPFVRYIEGD